MGKANTLVFEYANIRMIFDYSKFEYFSEKYSDISSNISFRPKVEDFQSESQSAYRQHRSTSDIIWAYKWLIA